MSEALEALDWIERHFQKQDIDFFDESFAEIRAALEQGEAVEPWGWVAKVPGSSKIITHSSCSASRWADECGLEVTAVYAAPPGTAEAQARALEDVADRIDARVYDALTAGGVGVATEQMRDEAKRIREEAK